MASTAAGKNVLSNIVGNDAAVAEQKGPVAVKAKVAERCAMVDALDAGDAPYSGKVTASGTSRGFSGSKRVREQQPAKQAAGPQSVEPCSKEPGARSAKRHEASVTAGAPGAAEAATSSACHGAGAKPSAPVPAKVALSAMHTGHRSEMAAVLRRLKVEFMKARDDWEEGTTHVVLPDLRRNEKTLGAMAAGR